MILQRINDSYRSGNVMGFLGYGDERLTIESRFSVGDNDFFFQYMIEKVLSFPNLFNLNTDVSIDNQMQLLLMFLFPSYLKAAMRKGVFMTYVKKKYNDENLRGRIDVNRHIRLNTPFIGNIAYDQREYTSDNYLMLLIRHAIEYLKKKQYGHMLLSKVKDQTHLVVEATPDFEPGSLRRILIENQKNTIRHAYYHEYRSLQHLCILILQHEEIRVGAGNRKFFGILFDGAWLWEEYIDSLVDKYFYHPKNRIGEGSQWLFSGNNGLIYPDFIGKDSSVRIIGDAKYKPEANIRSADYLQLLAYMFRFDAKKAFYFYPEVGDVSDWKLYLNSGSTYDKNIVARNDVFVTKHGLSIPSGCNDYSDFKQAMHTSEQIFLSALEEKNSDEKLFSNI